MVLVTNIGLYILSSSLCGKAVDVGASLMVLVTNIGLYILSSSFIRCGGLFDGARY